MDDGDETVFSPVEVFQAQEAPQETEEKEEGLVGVKALSGVPAGWKVSGDPVQTLFHERNMKSDVAGKGKGKVGEAVGAQDPPERGDPPQEAYP